MDTSIIILPGEVVPDLWSAIVNLANDRWYTPEEPDDEIVPDPDSDQPMIG